MHRRDSIMATTASPLAARWTILWYGSHASVLPRDTERRVYHAANRHRAVAREPRVPDAQCTLSLAVLQERPKHGKGVRACSSRSLVCFVDLHFARTGLNRLHR